MDYREKRKEVIDNTTDRCYFLVEEWANAVMYTADVVIIENTETGEHLWSIAPINEEEMWLDSFRTEKEAQEFCESLGYEVKGVRRLERDDKQDHLHRRPHP